MKVKVNNGITKRFRVTKNGAVIKRKNGQNKYNARETGKVRKNKRKPFFIAESHARVVRKLLVK